MAVRYLEIYYIRYLWLQQLKCCQARRLIFVDTSVNRRLGLAYFDVIMPIEYLLIKVGLQE